MNATRYLADRHVCGCFRFTLASSHLPTCGEGTGAVFQGESRPCPPLHRGVLEASFVYNSATGSDQSISSALLTHLDPTSSPNIALDRPTNRVKTRGHVFANERSIVFLRSNMRCVACYILQASRFSKIGFGQNLPRTRVISPAYNGLFLATVQCTPCSLFAFLQRRWRSGRENDSPRVSCPRFICLLAASLFISIILYRSCAWVRINGRICWRWCEYFQARRKRVLDII